jgi:hypothetical protein
MCVVGSAPDVRKCRSSFKNLKAEVGFRSGRQLVVENVTHHLKQFGANFLPKTLRTKFSLIIQNEVISFAMAPILIKIFLKLVNFVHEIQPKLIYIIHYRVDILSDQQVLK